MTAEEEDICTFTVSANERLFAYSNKSYLTRVMRIEGNDEDQKLTLTQVATFKVQKYFALELAFDPTNKLLALGMTDSSIKVYSIKQGF